jgi:hypothetical protein
VVDVVQASTSGVAWLDGSHESPGHQSGHELKAVLAAYRAGELAVLPLQKTSGVDHDGHQEFTLPQRQAEVAQGGHAADTDAVEGPAGRIFVRARMMERAEFHEHIGQENLLPSVESAPERTRALLA